MNNTQALTFDDLWGAAKPERGSTRHAPERKKPVKRDPLFVIDMRDAVTDAALPKLYRRASQEGRLDPGIAHEMGMETGTERCNVCGILCWDLEQAASCCRTWED